MEQYGTEIRLMPNQHYSVVFTVKGEETELSFSSEYSPLFSTARVVRNSFRKLFSSYSDDDINRIIHDNSKFALAVANPEIDLEQDIPFYVKQYVRYKTELDLLTDAFMTMSANGGSSDKTLGDFRIVKETLAPRDILPLIKLAERRLLPWELQLGGIKATPTGAVRAGATTYPVNGRNSF